MKKKPTASTTPWIVSHDGTSEDDAYAIECRRCGQKQRFACPINLDIWLAGCRVFMRQHAKCKARKKVPK